MSALGLVLLFTTTTLCLASSDISKEVFSAVKSGDADLIRVILDLNKDSVGSFINERESGSGQTPLMMAVLMGKVEVVRALLAVEEVDAGMGEKDGYTPLHGAGFQGRAEVARLLLADNRQLDPRTRHRDGFSPLHRACWGGEARHTETVAVFVQQGGVPHNQKSGKGTTCLQITTNSGTKKWLRDWASKSEL